MGSIIRTVTLALTFSALVSCGGASSGDSSTGGSTVTGDRALGSGEVAVYFPVNLGSSTSFISTYGISYTTDSLGVVRYIPASDEASLAGSTDSTSSTPRKLWPYTVDGAVYLVRQNTDTGTTYLLTEDAPGVLDGFSDYSYNDVDERILVRVGTDTYYRTERELDLFSNYTGGDIRKNGTSILPYGDGSNYLTDASPDFLTAGGTLYSMYKEGDLIAVIERDPDTAAVILPAFSSYTVSDHADYDTVWRTGMNESGAFWARQHATTGSVEILFESWSGAAIDTIFTDNGNGGSTMVAFDVDGTAVLIGYASGEMVILDTASDPIAFDVYDIGISPANAEIQQVR